MSEERKLKAKWKRRFREATGRKMPERWWAASGRRLAQRLDDVATERMFRAAEAMGPSFAPAWIEAYALSLEEQASSELGAAVCRDCGRVKPTDEERKAIAAFVVDYMLQRAKDAAVAWLAGEEPPKYREIPQEIGRLMRDRCPCRSTGDAGERALAMRLLGHSPARPVPDICDTRPGETGGKG